MKPAIQKTALNESRIPRFWNVPKAVRTILLSFLEASSSSPTYLQSRGAPAFGERNAAAAKAEPNTCSFPRFFMKIGGWMRRRVEIIPLSKRAPTTKQWDAYRSNCGGARD